LSQLLSDLSADAGAEDGKGAYLSQEIAEYTNINATQIRRDLSAFGKFGKRGVGY
jgi:redox-sensing transcriptional repressor